MHADQTLTWSVEGLAHIEGGALFCDGIARIVVQAERDGIVERAEAYCAYAGSFVAVPRTHP